MQIELNAVCGLQRGFLTLLCEVALNVTPHHTPAAKCLCTITGKIK